MYMESDLRGRVGIQEESRAASVSLKLGENKKDQPELSSWQVKWAGQRLLEHGLCQKPIRENIFRLTTNKIKRLNTTKIKTVCVRGIGRGKKNITTDFYSNRCLWRTSVYPTEAGAHLYLKTGERKKRETASRLNIHSKSQQVRRETEEKQSMIPAEQNRPKERVPYQVKLMHVRVSVCMWETPYGFVTKISLQPTNTKIHSKKNFFSSPLLPPNLSWTLI